MGGSQPPPPTTGGGRELTGQPVYSIGAVARMVGVPAPTLRTWQERYGVVVPERSEGGHRLYSRDQVEQLRFLADQVADGLSPADAHRLLRERLATLLAAGALTGDQRPADPTGSPAGPGGATAPGEPAPGPSGPGAATSGDPHPGAADETGNRGDASTITLLQPLTVSGRDADTLLVLLAERDPYAAEFSEYFLRTEGFRVALALDFDDALAKATATNPDLVIVDLMISAGRGVELCRQLVEHSQAPVLAICTLGLGDAALAAGAAAFLPKPIEPLQLVSAVRDLLGRSAFLQRERATR